MAFRHVGISPQSKLEQIVQDGMVLRIDEVVDSQASRELGLGKSSLCQKLIIPYEGGSWGSEETNVNVNKNNGGENLSEGTM